MIRKSLICLLFTLGLTGCIKPTPYQPFDGQQGYSQMALNKNLYRVSFAGNTNTSRQTVEDMLLRRAAELTQNAGYRYFIKYNQHVETKISTIETPTTIERNKDKRSEQIVINNGNTYTIHSYTATAMIQFLSNNKNRPHALDAQIILNNFNESMPQPN